MRTISMALINLFILIPVIFICKGYYSLLGKCIYLSSGVIYYIGKFACPDPDAFDEYLSLKSTKLIAEMLGWVFTIILISSTVLFITKFISWMA